MMPIICKRYYVKEIISEQDLEGRKPIEDAGADECDGVLVQRTAMIMACEIAQDGIDPMITHRYIRLLSPENTPTGRFVS